jgi:hypothetical protein
MHLAAACRDSSIGYATSANGTDWTATVTEPPANRLDSNPQVAVSGSTLYLAWTRQLQEDGGCGEDGIRDVGVNLKTRTLPDGSWSAASRIGEPKDHLQSLRVVGSTIHATVVNEADGKTWYETVDGDRVERTVIAGAAEAALRIGNDGVARIAYAHADGIRYGSVDHDGVRAETIPGSAHGSGPVFALAADGTAAMFWTRYEFSGGCAEPDPPPTDGTYFATNAGGSWKTEKISKVIGGVSLTIDSASGQIHALLGKERGIDYLHRPTRGGAWVKKALPIGKGWAQSPVIRQDPTTGWLWVFFAGTTGQGEGDDWAIQAMHR